MTIRAPFNFVPVHREVFIPCWANQISHDIPFEDGESGTITLNITAHSPIFVRNGHIPQDAKDKNDKYKSFSKDGNDRYFIPGTSIKGAIRNVLEIMSFSKMSQVEDDSFGLRDLNNVDDYRSKMVNIYCGWLQLVGDEYILIDCREPGRISLTEIDAHFNSKLVPFVFERQNFKIDTNRTAKAKYKLIGESILVEDHFVKDEELTIAMNGNNPKDYRQFMKFGDNSNGKNGTLVITGQPGVRQQIKNDKTGKLEWKGKFFEFIFLERDNPKEVPLKENSEVIKAFKSIHKNSPDYVDFWGVELKKGEKIPVFFKYLDEEKGKIESIGLSYLYKIPFAKSVFDATSEKHKESNLDLAESMFGHTNLNPLKGRVQFGHAFVDNKSPITKEPSKEIALATPHASYYPLYLGTMEGSNITQTWQNASSIAGWKRYPIRNTLLNNNTGTDKMKTPMIALSRNTAFTGKIRFHNLKHAEIGALLSSLTFHNTKNVFHNIGLAKPLGYGKISILATLEGELMGREVEFMGEFEKTMNKFCSSLPKKESVNSSQFHKLASLKTENEENSYWLTSAQLEELFGMAAGIPAGKDQDFSYMNMSNISANNEFKQAKDNREALKRFTNIIGQKPAINSVIKPIEIQVKEVVQTDSKQPTSSLNIGDIIEGTLIAPKRVKLKNIDVEVQCIIPIGTNSSNLLNNTIKVKIKQISKAGKISQVELISS